MCACMLVGSWEEFVSAFSSSDGLTDTHEHFAESSYPLLSILALHARLRLFESESLSVRVPEHFCGAVHLECGL